MAHENGKRPLDVDDPLADLRARGLVRGPVRPRPRGPLRKVKVRGTISDLVADQRR